MKLKRPITLPLTDTLAKGRNGFFDVRRLELKLVVDEVDPGGPARLVLAFFSRRPPLHGAPTSVELSLPDAASVASALEELVPHREALPEAPDGALVDMLRSWENGELEHVTERLQGYGRRTLVRFASLMLTEIGAQQVTRLLRAMEQEERNR